MVKWPTIVGMALLFGGGMLISGPELLAATSATTDILSRG